MILINMVYNIVENYKDNVTDTNLKEIINKKLLNIILLMESYNNEAD